MFLDPPSRSAVLSEFVGLVIDGFVEYDRALCLNRRSIWRVRMIRALNRAPAHER